MAKIDEIAPDVYRISITYKEIGLQFNHFLVKDDEPLLFHSGFNSMFDDLREGVSKIIKPEASAGSGSATSSRTSAALSTGGSISRPAPRRSAPNWAHS
jgi:hypothetical protein